MSSHTVVYLDQNYLSNMAKARYSLIKDKDQAEFWRSLFDDLKEAVLADKMACPQLEFHRHEASYDRRLEEPIRKVIDELSWQLKFHPSTSILESQIDDAAKNFLGKQLEERESWAIAFKSNPHAPVESRMTDILGIKGQINVHLSFSDELVEHDRRLKGEFANGAVLPVAHQHTYRNWFELVQREKISFVYSFSGPSLLEPVYQHWLKRWYSSSPLGGFVANARIKEVTRFWGKLAEIGIDINNPTKAADFLTSDELLDIPYIDIYCSIHAAIIRHYPNRKMKQGDFYDIPILSSVLPYCDMVTTDSFMKEIVVKILHFDDKYKAMIFPATKADRLAFQKFIGGL